MAFWGRGVPLVYILPQRGFGESRGAVMGFWWLYLTVWPLVYLCKCVGGSDICTFDIMVLTTAQPTISPVSRSEDL